MAEGGLIKTREEKVSADGLLVSPEEVRLDICSLCQLQCVLCPVGYRKGEDFIGSGVLPFADFARFIDDNPRVRTIEIGSSGEVFLNPDLPAMLQYAWGKGVAIRIDQGSNLNNASGESLEALVRYGVTILKVSIDGATQETYQKYRVGGQLRKVLENVHKINDCKKKYKSSLPRLILQFIPFGHNEHEIDKIMVMAKALGMDIYFKLNVFTEHFPLRNHERLKKLIGFSDTNSFYEKTGKIYMRNVCLQIWRAPQISWNGRLLGCSHNVTGSFAENALNGKFAEESNNERMQYARKMHMGLVPARSDIPCSTCDVYADYQKYNQWFTLQEIKVAMNSPHAFAVDHE